MFRKNENEVREREREDLDEWKYEFGIKAKHKITIMLIFDLIKGRNLTPHTAIYIFLYILYITQQFNMFKNKYEQNKKIFFFFSKINWSWYISVRV